MSYLHCPTCQCAYNVAREVACPRCGVRPGTPADPTEDVVAATDALLRAIARATPDQLVAAESTLERRPRLALPAVSAAVSGGTAAGAMPIPRADGSGPIAMPPRGRPVAILRAVRAALAPPPRNNDATRALMTTVALALLTRIATPPLPRVRSWAQRARAFVARATA